MTDLESLISELQTKTGVSSVYLARYLDGETPRVESLVFLHHDKFFPIFSYALNNAPCQRVYQQEYFFCPKGIDEEFPGDSDLKKLSIVAYEGMILEKDEQTLGHIALLDQTEAASHKDLLLQYASKIIAKGWL